MSNITYSVAEYTAEDRTVEVTYTNADGHIHTRQINIPKTSEGAVDTEYLTEIFEGQLAGVENKVKVGAITFVDPNASAETEESPTE
jgi:hypothetical protein